jgi:hypothetical protein
MDAATLTFGIKDVVAIIVGVISIASFIWALKNSNEKNHAIANQALNEVDALEKSMDEKILHEKNSKKANIQFLMDEIAQVKAEVEKKETIIYNKITEIRTEQKEGHDKLSSQILLMTAQLNTIGNNVSELTGYTRAQKETK